MITGDALLDLSADVIALAVVDLRNGPGKTARQRRRYQSAVDFLTRIGLLDRVVAQHDVVLEPQQLELIAA